MQIFDQMQLLLLSVNSQSILIIGSGSGFGYGTSFEISALVCFVFQFCNKCMVCVLVLRRGSTFLRPLWRQRTSSCKSGEMKGSTIPLVGLSCFKLRATATTWSVLKHIKRLGGFRHDFTLIPRSSMGQEKSVFSCNKSLTRWGFWGRQQWIWFSYQ